MPLKHSATTRGKETVLELPSRNPSPNSFRVAIIRGGAPIPAHILLWPPCSSPGFARLSNHLLFSSRFLYLFPSCQILGRAAFLLLLLPSPTTTTNRTLLPSTSPPLLPLPLPSAQATASVNARPCRGFPPPKSRSFSQELRAGQDSCTRAAPSPSTTAHR
jgi:hypothetical protein